MCTLAQGALKKDTMVIVPRTSEIEEVLALAAVKEGRPWSMRSSTP
jgi:hypothetical protein